MKRKTTIPAGKERINFDDDQSIVRQLDDLAAQEGLSRSDMCRRALRVFLSSGSMYRTIPSKEPADLTTA
jgi:hypothetical protein